MQQSVLTPQESVYIIIRLRQVIQKTGLSRSTIYTLIKEDKSFPQQIKMTPRTMGFVEAEIDTWIAARVAASKAA